MWDPRRIAGHAAPVGLTPGSHAKNQRAGHRATSCVGSSLSATSSRFCYMISKSLCCLVRGRAARPAQVFP